MPQAMSPTMPETAFRDVEGLLAFVDQKKTAFQQGTLKMQYVLIRHVPRDVFDNLLIRSARLHYDFDSGDLVAKLMPGAPHNDATAILAADIQTRVAKMGLDISKLRPTTTTRYAGARSAKEGDAGFKPMPERRGGDKWPTLVVECGVSESLPRLRIDAGWWLTNSKGDVKLVIVISFNVPAKRFILEKWQLGPPYGSDTRAQSDPEHRVPRSMVSITIAPDPTSNNFIASNELVIEFADLFLRPPVFPEMDLVFTRVDLENWADLVVSGL